MLISLSCVETPQKTMNQIESCFHAAISTDELVNLIKNSLLRHGFGERSLVATSFCCDEVNRYLEKDLGNMYGRYFNLGGLAGFPFSGVTGFATMLSHVPDGGSCLVVYGPHVGIDTEGNVGRVNHRGRLKAGSCCSSAVAAASYASDIVIGKQKEIPPPDDPLDAQQNYVTRMILPHGNRVRIADKPMVELPKSMFDVQDELMQRIVNTACDKVDDGKIAILGGIHINTPDEMSDYFVPLRFDVINSRGVLIDRILKFSSRVSCNIPVFGFAGNVVLKKLPTELMLLFSQQATVSKIFTIYPRAITVKDLVDRVHRSLAGYGFGKTSILATSLCSEEVTRPLEDAFSSVYGHHFSIGGLGGMAFGGVTSFMAMAQYIPDNGSCFIVYGPHVGIDEDGKVGTISLRGKRSGGACCGSAVAALMYCHSVASGSPEKVTPTDPIDAQQTFLCNMLLPQAQRVEKAEDPMVELPLALFDCQDKHMQKVVARGCGHVPRSGKIALLGGVQINTPENATDYFLPLRFEVLNSRGEVIEDLLWYER